MSSLLNCYSAFPLVHDVMNNQPLVSFSVRKCKWEYPNETTASLPQIVSECGNGLPTDCYSMLDRGDGFPRLLVSSQYGSAGDLTAAKRTAYNAWRKGKRNPVGSSLIRDRTKKPAGLVKKDFDANSMLQNLKKSLTLLRLRKLTKEGKLITDLM